MNTVLINVFHTPKSFLKIDTLLEKHAIKEKELPNYVHDIEHVEEFGKVLFVVMIQGSTYYFNAKCGNEITGQIESSYSGHEFDAGDRWTAPAGGGSFEDHKEAVEDDITRAWLFNNLDKWNLEDEG